MTGAASRSLRPSAVAFRANTADPRHGTPNGYCNLGCRCQRCTEGWRVDHLAYMQQRPEQAARQRDRDRVRRWGVPVAYRSLGYRNAAGVARALGMDEGQFSRQRPEPTVTTPGGRRLWSPAAVEALAVERAVELVARALRRVPALTPELRSRVVHLAAEPHGTHGDRR